MKTAKNQPNRMVQPTPKAIRFASGPPVDRAVFTKQMFQEDLYSGIAPHSWRREEKLILLTGNEHEQAKLSTLCASLGGGRSFSVERSVADAIQTIAIQLVHHGTAFFEKLGGSNDVPLTLFSFSPEHAWSGLGFFLQLVPLKSWRYTDRKYAFIPSRAVWRLSLPRQLGSVRKYRAMLAQLSAWPTLGPSFVQSELKTGHFPADFSVQDYGRLLRIHQYRVTRDWGWTTRDWSLDYVTEFYQFYRLATFKWAQTVLREHIVSELNNLLSQQGIGVRIALQNVPSASSVLEVREKLKQGTIDFAGVNKAVETRIA